VLLLLVPRENLQDLAAEAISLVFNAPANAMLTFLIVYLCLDPAPPIQHLLVSLLFAGILPIAFVYALFRMGVIGDIYASDRGSRLIPFLSAISCYALGLALLSFMGSPFTLVSLMACYLGNSLAMMLISTRWKISLHAAGIGGPSAFLISQVDPGLWPFTLLAIPICWARWRLKAHGVGQLAAGVVLTAALTLAQVDLYRWLWLSRP
jgi:hypothetical protein